jgi:hypothetical protein
VRRIDFFRQTVCAETDECILWPFNRSKAGYGYVSVAGVAYGVHVLACELAHGARPPGAFAVHAPGICHEPACYNRRHVRWADQRANLADRLIDGTANRGLRNGAVKLTEGQVVEIRRLVSAGDSRREVARSFGVSRQAVDDIVNGVTWGWLGR